MKRRRLFIGAFLLAAVTFLGIGYAALTNTLQVNGSLSATENKENLKVEFVDYEAHATKTPGGAEDTSFTVNAGVSGQTATISVDNMSIPNQTAEITFKVQNKSVNLASLTAELAAEFNIELGEGTLSGSTYSITSEATDGNTSDKNKFTGEHFVVSVAYSENAEDLNVLDESTGVVTLDSGEYVYVVVTITLVDIVPENFELHVVKISFDASTITESVDPTPEP